MKKLKQFKQLSPIKGFHTINSKNALADIYIKSQQVPLKYSKALNQNDMYNYNNQFELKSGSQTNRLAMI